MPGHGAGGVGVRFRYSGPVSHKNYKNVRIKHTNPTARLDFTPSRRTLPTMSFRRCMHSLVAGMLFAVILIVGACIYSCV